MFNLAANVGNTGAAFSSFEGQQWLFALIFAAFTGMLIWAACSALAGVGGGLYSAISWSLMADAMDYGEWKTGQRNEGMITSTRCFVTKLVMAVSGVVVAFVMGIFGYNPGGEQTMEMLNAIHTMMTVVCAGTMLIGVVPMFFYNLTEKKHAEIMAELAARKAQN